MPRSVTITGAPFDYRLSPVAVQHFADNGVFTVKDEVADYIVDRGLGFEGKEPGAKSKNGKGGPKRRRARGSAARKGSGPTRSSTSGSAAAKADADAKASDIQPVDGVDGAGLADADSASNRQR